MPACATANTTFGKIGTGLHIAGMNSQSKVPPLAARGNWRFHDQRTEDTRTSGETGLRHREKEKERHIETRIAKDTDRPAMIALATVGIEAVVEAGVAVGEEIGHRTMEVHLVEK